MKSSPAVEIKNKFERAKKKSEKKINRRLKHSQAKNPADNNSATKKDAKSGQAVNPHVTRPTLAEEVDILNRRWKVWDYYKTGASIRQISEILTAQGVEGSSVGQVHADLHFILNLQHKDLALSVEQHIENEIAILNDIQLTYYPQMKDKGRTVLGEDKDAAAKIIIMCVKERGKLRNLYKPIKVEHGIDEMLAELMDLDPEELPDDNDADNHHNEE